MCGCAFILDNVGRTGRESHFRAALATRGGIGVEIRRVTVGLAQGAAHAPKGAAAIFAPVASLFGNVILFAEAVAQAKGYNHDKQVHARVQDPAQVAGPSVAARPVNVAIRIFGRVYSGLKDRTENRRKDNLENPQNEKNLAGRRSRRFSVARFSSRPEHVHARQDLSQRTRLTPKGKATDGMAAPKGAAIAESIAPTAKRNVVRAAIHRVRDNGGLKALT